MTGYHIAILVAVGVYYTLTREMIQDLCCPNDNNGRVTRKRILQLVQLGLLNKTRMEVVNPAFPEGRTPVYYPSRKGLESLACHFKDESWLDRCCLTPNWQHLLHWVAVARIHIMLDRSASLKMLASIAGWFGEWDVVNADEKEPDKRFLLYTKFSENPRRICNPDFAFLLEVASHSKIYYGEIDRGTSGIQQIAHSKTPGYAALAESKLHRRHFETTTDSFFVLHISATAGRRDAILRTISDKPGAALWKFAALSDLTPETLLYEPVWYRCDGQIQSLIRPVPSPAEAVRSKSGSGPEPVPGEVRAGTPSNEVGI
jgi:hypothetical protein